MEINGVVTDLDAFCCENRNVHRKVKDWAHQFRTLSKGLVEETERLREECLKNEDEVK